MVAQEVACLIDKMNKEKERIRTATASLKLMRKSRSVFEKSQRNRGKE